MAGRNPKRRALALMMTAVMAASCTGPALAAPIGSGVTPTYDEAYYATLDYYGNLMEGSVVKSYSLNGASSLVDYGTYDQVVNLTDNTPITMSAGHTAFQFGQAPEHFYFEGKTAQPFQSLPWTITLRYTLNGVPTPAEELAGKTGVVEILLDLVPNPYASSYARYNYTLEAMALFNQDDILALEAPGAQVQLVGNLRTVLFMALPGEEKHFSIRVGSNDFSFGGLTVLMVPATLDQLEEIAKLSQRKDDLEEDYRALSGSLDALLDAMNDIQGGLYASAKGLDQLDTARGTISGGKGLLYDDAGVVRGDLSSIADLLEPVEQRTLALSQTITSSKAVLGEMTDTAVSLQGQLEALEEALEQLESGATDVRQVVRGLADMKSSLRSLQRALGDTHVGGSSSGDRNDLDLKGKVEKTKQIGGIYSSDDATYLNQMLALKGKTPEEIAGINDLLRLSKDQAAAAGMEQQWQEAKAAKDSLDALHQQSFQQFCDTLLKEQNPSLSDRDRAEQAKQMNDLWTIVKPAPSGQAAQASEEPAPEQGAPEAEAPLPEEAEPAADALAAGLSLTGRLKPAAGLMSGALAGGSICLDASQPPASDPEPAPASDPVPAPASDPEPAPAEDPTPEDHPAPTPGGSSSGGQTPGGAAVDLIVGGLDQAMNAANDRINAIQSELNSTINRITRPTGRVVGELADLCDDVEDLVDLIDSAEDLSAALRQSSGKIRDILGDIDALRGILDEYEATLQESVANVGTLSTSAVTVLRDLETALADTESLMKRSGSQLDAGTRQTLRGLASTLRQTAQAMAATNDVRSAKTTITDIIEETWNEYTGDVNNILLMDAEARPVSLTDSRNPAPSSVQVLIRTQEIKAEQAEQTAELLSAKEPTTFWDRVVQMFRDFWTAISGIFH